MTIFPIKDSMKLEEPEITTAPKQARSFILAIVLGLFGALLNYAPIELTYNMSLAIGNVAFIIAAAYLRPTLTLLCALICITPFAFSEFGQLFSFIVFGFEAIFISVLRNKNNYLPKADFLYWLVVGMPLTAVFIWLTNADAQSYLLFYLFLHLINGVFYSAVAVIVIVIVGDRFSRWRVSEQTPLVKNINEYLHYILWVMSAFLVIGICLFFSRILNDIQHKQFEGRMEISAHYLGEITENYMGEHIHAIEKVANELSLIKPEHYASVLSAAHQIYPGYLTMLIANKHGNLIASSPNSLLEKVPDNSFSVVDRAYFSEAFYHEKLYVSPVFLGRGFGVEPIVAISSPIYYLDSKYPTGIVEGSLNLNMFEQSKANSEDIKVVLTDRNNNVIYSDKALGLSPLSRFDFSIEKSTLKHKIMLVSAQNNDVKKYMYQQVNLNNGWKIYIVADHNQILSLIEQQYLTIFMLLFIIFIFVVLLASQFAHTLNKPLAFALKELAGDDVQQSYKTIPFEAPTEFLTLYKKLQQAQERQRKHQFLLEQKVELRTRELNQANETLKELANHDSLTGLLNRRSLEKKFSQLQASLSRNKANMVVAMLDLDHFKALNDEYGHLAGDNCLQYISNLMKNKFDRRSDVVARFGGEEFVIITQHDEHNGVLKKLEELCEDISLHRLPHDNENYIVITISIGVMVAPAHYSEKIEDWISVADKELYWVKENGRNQMKVKFHDDIKLKK